MLYSIQRNLFRLYLGKNATDKVLIDMEIYLMKNNATKKIATILTATLLSVLSASAMACPKGTTLTGGTGPNHKGGSCVPANTQKKTPELKQTEKKTTTAAKKQTENLKQTPTKTTTAVQAKVNSAIPADKTTKTK